MTQNYPSASLWPKYNIFQKGLQGGLLIFVQLNAYKSTKERLIYLDCNWNVLIVRKSLKLGDGWVGNSQKRETLTAC